MFALFQLILLGSSLPLLQYLSLVTLRAPCPLLQGQNCDLLLLQETPCAATLAVPHPAAYSK